MISGTVPGIRDTLLTKAGTDSCPYEAYSLVFT